jgi:uncharacterized Ntn-hydrolase superfamily protein
MRLPSAAFSGIVLLGIAAGCSTPVNLATRGDEVSGVPCRPVATYSIVARDPATGDLGVAVQSHWFSVGPIVPFAEAGVGAVATQSFVDPSYGPLGLALMRAGKSAEEALRGLVASDAGEAVRQVAMVDASGRVAAHTGERCIAAAGHHVGEGYSVQANLMERETVWPAMAKAFESAKGTLARRLVAALYAAESEGGDIRGRQSAALLVVRGNSTGRPWADRIVELRVEDHPDPLVELERLLTIHEAYEHMNRGDEAVAAGKLEEAAREYGLAQSLQPGNPEISFWYGVALASKGWVDESLPHFRRAFEGEKRLRDLVPRLPASGLLPADDALIRRITSIK